MTGLGRSVFRRGKKGVKIVSRCDNNLSGTLLYCNGQLHRTVDGTETMWYLYCCNMQTVQGVEGLNHKYRVQGRHQRRPLQGLRRMEVRSTSTLRPRRVFTLTPGGSRRPVYGHSGRGVMSWSMIGTGTRRVMRVRSTHGNGCSLEWECNPH